MNAHKLSKDVFRSPDHQILLRASAVNSPFRSPICESAVHLASMRVLGIDCGSEYTGYGVVEETADQKLVCHVNGAIKLKSGTPMAAKLEKIFGDLTAIIAKYQPEIVAIEDVFYAVNVKTALKLGQVRGVAMLAASTSGLQVAEYSPLS